MEEYIDTEDRTKLIIAILKQAMDDYIKLQHPKFRKKKYLLEAFQNAVDMFFDSEYRFLYIQDSDGKDVSVKELLSILLNSNDPEMINMQEHLITEALQFWNSKEINVVDIPDTIQVDGHVYHILHTEEDDYAVNVFDKSITLNKQASNSENQEQFVMAITELILHHQDIPLSKKNIQQLGKGWFRLLKLNNCFIPYY